MTADNILHVELRLLFWKLLSVPRRWVGDIWRRKSVPSSASVLGFYGLLHSGLMPYSSQLLKMSISLMNKMPFRQYSFTEVSQTFLTKRSLVAVSQPFYVGLLV
jgi:hypothetical protein